ncbi:hypothetical protein H5410_032119, partial [Solanum commersonii]
DNKDVGWAENRSKKLSDPLVMANVSIENVKKDVPSSLKAKLEKTPKKRGRKVSSPISRPSLPKSVKYKIKQIPTHSLRFGSTYNMNFVEDLNLSIGVKGVELFKNTIFGPYLNIPNCNYQGQITKCLLLLELEQDNIDELHIRHASGNILHFTIKEFAIITGLKCTGNVDEFRYPDSTHSRLIQRYFPESNDSVNKGHLVQRFLMGEWENYQDAVEMAILYFIHTFVFSQLGDTNIPIHHFFMVEDGRYQKYSWGQIAFSKLMKTLRQKFTKEKKLYRLAGMPYSLNVWIYECASIISDEIVVKEGSYIPRICNWRVVGVKPKFDMFMSSIFTQNACNDIHPTTEEMSALDLPANVNTSPSETHTSTAKSKQVQPQDLLEFENFSTNHTDQFLRRSRCMSTTSSTPPPKRRRNAHPAKPKVTQVNQPEQLAVQTKQKIPIPDSGGNLFDIHGPSFDRKESSDKSGIKQVKKYLKHYVDKKFQHLEDLIKLNHIELVNVVRNPDKQEEENIVGTSIPTTVSGFQEGHFAHPSSTDQMFEQRNSSIVMDFPNNDPIEVDVVDAQEQNHNFEQKVVEDVDTCKDKEGMNDVSDLPYTTDVHDKASVSKKDNDSTTSNSISSETQEAVDALLYGLRAPMNAQPLQAITPQQVTGIHDMILDIMLPMYITGNEIVVHEESKTHVQRLRPSSKIF